MHHGNKYEDVSIMFYEHKYNTKIRDYGCIQHDTYKFLGASPDGINVEPNSELYGRMLEIKNPTYLSADFADGRRFLGFNLRNLRFNLWTGRRSPCRNRLNRNGRSC